MPLKKTFFALCFLCLAQGALRAQGAGSGNPAEGDFNNLGTWNILNLRWQYNPRWNFFAEGQLRSLSFYNEFHYYEYKAGVNYQLDKNFIIGAGLGNYRTHPEGGDFVRPKLNDEIRSWLQITMLQYLRILKFEHRYRIEQRWTLQGYRNRFRYRLQLNIPLNKNRIEPGTVYLSVWNELFGTDTAPYFERNRFFLGGGYELNKHVAFQAGWVNQLDYKINDEIGRNFMQIGVYLSY